MDLSCDRMKVQKEDWIPVLLLKLMQDESAKEDWILVSLLKLRQDESAKEDWISVSLLKLRQDESREEEYGFGADLGREKAVSRERTEVLDSFFAGAFGRRKGWCHGTF